VSSIVFEIWWKPGQQCSSTSTSMSYWFAPISDLLPFSSWHWLCLLFFFFWVPFASVPLTLPGSFDPLRGEFPTEQLKNRRSERGCDSWLATCCTQVPRTAKAIEEAQRPTRRGRSFGALSLRCGPPSRLVGQWQWRGAFHRRRMRRSYDFKIGAKEAANLVV